ncbi:hypothetical protein B0T19DRAFT_197861 [Cercophora scortea]|uniref:Uncharacterized protein n=1 Tax=Cercophora scortea TaxID=314031 RepID=A0AAE0IPG1_9PEZI|nr:hypothetical protein B0T19DRAFT_197861 [Cercophora scortea]
MRPVPGTDHATQQGSAADLWEAGNELRSFPKQYGEPASLPRNTPLELEAAKQLSMFSQAASADISRGSTPGIPTPNPTPKQGLRETQAGNEIESSREPHLRGEPPATLADKTLTEPDLSHMMELDPLQLSSAVGLFGGGDLMHSSYRGRDTTVFALGLSYNARWPFMLGLLSTQHAATPTFGMADPEFDPTFSATVGDLTPIPSPTSRLVLPAMGELPSSENQQSIFTSRYINPTLSTPLHILANTAVISTGRTDHGDGREESYHGNSSAGELERSQQMMQPDSSQLSSSGVLSMGSATRGLTTVIYPGPGDGGGWTDPNYHGQNTTAFTLGRWPSLPDLGTQTESGELQPMQGIASVPLATARQSSDFSGSGLIPDGPLPAGWTGGTGVLCHHDSSEVSAQNASPFHRLADAAGQARDRIEQSDPQQPGPARNVSPNTAESPLPAEETADTDSGRGGRQRIEATPRRHTRRRNLPLERDEQGPSHSNVEAEGPQDSDRRSAMLSQCAPGPQFTAVTSSSGTTEDTQRGALASSTHNSVIPLAATCIDPTALSVPYLPVSSPVDGTVGLVDDTAGNANLSTMEILRERSTAIGDDLDGNDQTSTNGPFGPGDPLVTT